MQPLQTVALSAFILLVIGLQAMAGARIRGPLKPDPDRWPFLGYTMYTRAHFPGEPIPRHRVFGILGDSSEVEVNPEALGAHYWIWEKRLVRAFDPVDPSDLRAMAALYHARRGERLLGFRLEDHPLLLTDEGIEEGASEVLASVWLDDLPSESPAP